MDFFIASQPKMPMKKWDVRFCKLAKYISKWSKDPNAKVGAVLVSNKGGRISVGYNGFPSGVQDSKERLDNNEKKLEIVVHAELNTLISAGSNTDGATIYVWGKPICAKCAGSIIQAGVKRVVSLKPKSADESNSKWDKSGAIAKEMFEEAGIIIDFYVFENKKITNKTKKSQ
jgi:dCMP deaminase